MSCGEAASAVPVMLNTRTRATAKINIVFLVIVHSLLSSLLHRTAQTVFAWSIPIGCALVARKSSVLYATRTLEPFSLRTSFRYSGYDAVGEVISENTRAILGSLSIRLPGSSSRCGSEPG